MEKDEAVSEKFSRFTEDISDGKRLKTVYGCQNNWFSVNPEPISPS
jgi:hypothetical protein